MPLRPFHLSEAAGLSREAIEDAVRARAQAVHLGDGLVLARALGRFKMYLEAQDIGFAGHLMLDGYWESWLTRFLAGLVRPGMRAVDVGANVGYHALALADLCGPNGDVVAVEPNPAAARLLARNLSLNGFGRTSRVVQMALGADADGRRPLFVPNGEPKNAALVPPGFRGAGALVDVPVTTLDALIGTDAAVDVLKIDAEGAEAAILDGARGLLTRCRPHLVLEFNAARYPDPAAVLAPLVALYGAVARIDYDGDAKPAEPRAIASDRSGEDQLLYFARP